MKKIDAKKFFWFLIAINVLLIAATMVVFTQASSAGEKKSQKIQEFKANDQANDQLISYYKVLQNTLNSNKDLDGMIQKILPSDKDQAGALIDLDRISKNTGVVVKQMNFNPGTNKGSGKTLTSPSGIPGVSTISVSLNSASTPYQNLLYFLSTIETTQRRMQVTSLNITPNNTNPDLLDRIDMTVDIYLKDSSSKD